MIKNVMTEVVDEAIASLNEASAKESKSELRSSKNVIFADELESQSRFLSNEISEVERETDNAIW